MRLPWLVRQEPEIEALFVRMARHAAESFRESLGIAMFATGRDLGAPSHRVPGRVRPLDG